MGKRDIGFVGETFSYPALLHSAAAGVKTKQSNRYVGVGGVSKDMRQGKSYCVLISRACGLRTTDGWMDVASVAALASGFGVSPPKFITRYGDTSRDVSLAVTLLCSCDTGGRRRRRIRRRGHKDR